MRSSFEIASLCSLLLASSSAAISIPANVQNLYDSIVRQGECKNKAATGFYALSDGTNDFSYCQDHLDDYGIIYLQGSSGALADMDIDCDGNQDEPSSSANDGRCGKSSDTQSDTSYEDTVKSYGKGISNLNPYIHTYVVFGNSNDGNTAGYKTFDPTKYGIEPLSLMAVVCNKQVIFGIWGDTNGDDDGSKAMVGEAAISTGTLCFGDSITGDNGHSDLDILYIAFNGTDAVPGASGAKWDATSADDFESSLETLGTKLLERIGSSGSSVTTNSTSTSSLAPALAAGIDVTSDAVSSRPSASVKSNPSSGGDGCSWSGHCAGASCSTSDDCSGDMVCSSGTCSLS